MRVMVFAKANKESEAGVLPNKEILTKMGNQRKVLLHLSKEIFFFFFLFFFDKSTENLKRKNEDSLNGTTKVGALP